MRRRFLARTTVAGGLLVDRIGDDGEGTGRTTGEPGNETDVSAVGTDRNGFDGVPNHPFDRERVADVVAGSS